MREMRGAGRMIDDSPTIHIVDDDDLFRTATGRLLLSCGYQVELYDSAQRFLNKQVGQTIGCILLDVKMPGLSGPELQNLLAKNGSILPIIFLTGHGDIPTSVLAIKAGAEDFLSKPISKATLVDAVQRALSRCQQTREQVLQLAAMRALLAKLTPRENEVFALVVRGKLNKQIAHELGTSERTIKAHRHAIMEKLQVQSVARAVSFAERLGLLTPLGSDAK
jgi:RNA polymerase sigma factor (sigma-70 family)